MRKRFIPVCVLLVAGNVWLFSQSPAPIHQIPAPPSASTPAELTPKAPYDSKTAELAIEKEKNLQLQSELMRRQFDSQIQQMGQQYTDLEKQLLAWQDGVKKANDWGAEVTYDREHNRWVKNAPAAPSPVPPTPDPKPSK